MVSLITKFTNKYVYFYSLGAWKGLETKDNHLGGVIEQTFKNHCFRYQSLCLKILEIVINASFIGITELCCGTQARNSKKHWTIWIELLPSTNHMSVRFYFTESSINRYRCDETWDNSKAIVGFPSSY